VRSPGRQRLCGALARLRVLVRAPVWFAALGFVKCMPGAGYLVSVDAYMNLQLASTEEYIDGQFTGNLGEVLIRCVPVCRACVRSQAGDACKLPPCPSPALPNLLRAKQDQGLLGVGAQVQQRAVHARRARRGGGANGRSMTLPPPASHCAQLPGSALAHPA